MARAPTRRTERCSAADRATPQGCFKCAHCGVQLKKFYELDDKAYCQQAYSEDRNTGTECVDSGVLEMQVWFADMG